MRTLFILLGMLAFVTSFAQKESANVNAGNKLYNKQKYTEAESAYRDALKKNKKSFEANYNLGNALYKQNKYAEALNAYKQALPLTQDKKRLASAMHNLGNSLMTQRQYDKALEAYKQSLLLNPNDNETRFNYAFAKAMMKNQQNKNKDKKNKDQQKQQDKKDQNKKDQKNNNQQNNNQNQNNKDQQNKNQQQQPQGGGMSKQNAEQILDAIQQNEKNVQQKMNEKKIKARSQNAEKDW